MSKDISYSIFIDQNPSDSLTGTMPRRSYKWTPDKDVSLCYGCHSSFSLFHRKHHCRFCGKIFCNKCVIYDVYIPNELLSDDSKMGSSRDYYSSIFYAKNPNKHIVCKPCEEFIKFIEDVNKLISMFIILKFDVIMLRSINVVCKSWRNSCNYILSLFREIQYKIPTETFKSIEIELLWNNINNLCGHSKYLVQLLKACKNMDEYKKAIPILKLKKAHNCRLMMCGRNCHNRLTSFDAINLLCHSFQDIGYNYLLREVLLEHLDCSDDEFICYIPLLVHNLKNDSGIVAQFLLNRCINSPRLLSSLHWELGLHLDGYTNDRYSTLSNKLKSTLSTPSNKGEFLNITEGTSFVQILKTISNAICTDNKKYDDIKNLFVLKEPMSHPLNHAVKIDKINIEKIQIKESATKPLIIPCMSGNTVINILYKNEDVRKDQVIMNVIKLSNMIIKEEEGIDLGIVTYGVLPIGEDCGLIEIVGNCDTIYSIQEKLKLTILNYILEGNGDAQVKVIRERFTKSTAAFCVLTYLFGIGDRHLDNIMVTRDGQLFHIDYGYILGNDPVVSDPGIRITGSMIEAIGGVTSDNYKYFKQLCNKIYNCLRRHVDIFINMLLVLSKISNVHLTEKQIVNELVTRFLPKQGNEEASLHISAQIEKQNYIDSIKDWCHYHSKERTLNNAVGKIGYALSNVINATK